MSSSKHLPKF